jgi:hypothetical protein
MTDAQFARLTRLPPVKWQEAVDKMGQAERMEVARRLDEVAINAARLAGYVEARCPQRDRGHDNAVKESNRKARKVGKVLGYSLATAFSF